MRSGDGHSSGANIATRLGATHPDSLAWKPASHSLPWRAVPTWSCSRWGFQCRFRCRKRGGLLPHPFTLARPEGLRRFAFCCTFPGVAPAGCYPAPCFLGARTFLSLPKQRAAIRPTDMADLDPRGAKINGKEEKYRQVFFAMTFLTRRQYRALIGFMRLA